MMNSSLFLSITYTIGYGCQSSILLGPTSKKEVDTPSLSTSSDL
jgi:hypothetical protein